MVPPAFLRSLAGIIYGVSQLRRENLRDRSDVFLTLLKIESENYFRKWSGRRESNPYYQLGKVNTALFIFNTYKTAHEKYACMHCIPCIHCLICVSLRDVLRDDSLPILTSILLGSNHLQRSPGFIQSALKVIESLSAFVRVISFEFIEKLLHGQQIKRPDFQAGLPRQFRKFRNHSSLEQLP